jgi:hypothetical protein
MIRNHLYVGMVCAVICHMAVAAGGQQVLINEIMHHPPTENDQDEYIELYNAGAKPVNLRDYELSKAVRLRFPEVVIAPHGYVVVTADVQWFQVRYPTVSCPVIGGWDGKLSNRFESIRRKDHSEYLGSDTYHFTTLAFETVPMTLDTKGQYVATLSPQSHGTIVEFYIEVEDHTGQTRTFPAPAMVDGHSEQITNLLYQVDDSVDPDHPWQKGDQPVYRVIMTRAEHDQLAIIGDAEFEGDWWASEAMSNAQLNGTFISMDARTYTRRPGRQPLPLYL